MSYIKYTLIFTIICFGSVNSQTNCALHLLLPGVGYDNFKINVSSSQDITNYYGDTYSFDTFYYPYPFDTTKILSFGISYDTLGLYFYFNPINKILSGITVKLPFRAITDKEIILGESSFNDIIIVYGDVVWSSKMSMNVLDTKAIGKCYDGISFYCDYITSQPLSDSLLKSKANNIINTIEIEEFKRK